MAKNSNSIWYAFAGVLKYPFMVSLIQVFQDDGKIASLSTSATYDLERGLLYISGKYAYFYRERADKDVVFVGPRSPALSICKIRNV